MTGMSWFPEQHQRSWLQRTCASILKAGPIPKHVGIIMDGNRRFATKNSMDRAEGHLRGFDKLADVCLIYLFLSAALICLVLYLREREKCFI